MYIFFIRFLIYNVIMNFLGLFEVFYWSDYRAQLITFYKLKNPKKLPYVDKVS